MVLALLVAGCSTPVPQAKLSYVGEWEGADMWLLITQDGRVEYERKRNGASSSISAPIKAWQGDDFLVGIGIFTTTFKVSKTPYLDGKVWKMVVDGVELKRIGGAVRSEWVNHSAGTYVVATRSAVDYR